MYVCMYVCRVDESGSLGRSSMYVCMYVCRVDESGSLGRSSMYVCMYVCMPCRRIWVSW
jgi:hypothetical protein